MLYIGIDTGVNTGLAVWDSLKRKLVELTTVKIHKAMERVAQLSVSDDIAVYFEDARQRKWIPQDPTYARMKGRLQGAGSVKRDATIWEDFLKDLGVEYHAIAPKNNATKMNADFFAKVTGWQGKTSEHARDAAMLVFNR